MTASYAEILEHLAPCGLNCRKCYAHESGSIRAISDELQKALGAFGPYAERFSKAFPALLEYPAFERVLCHLAAGDCRGCRKDRCRFFECRVVDCHRGRGVDFCFQCSEFPCADSGFQGGLFERWVKTGRRMKEDGVERFFEDTRDDPRYPGR